MQLDHSAAEEIRNQLLATARQADPALQVLNDMSTAYAVDSFSEITPPEDPLISIGWISVTLLHETPKAKSRKAGNIILNWRKLINIVPDVSLAGFGAATASVAQGWVIALAGIYIWNKLVVGSEEDFSESEAIAIVAMWRHRNYSNKISESDAFVRNNDLRSSYEFAPITGQKFSWIINRLANLRCIEIEGGIICLRERISVKYT